MNSHIRCDELIVAYDKQAVSYGEQTIICDTVFVITTTSFQTFSVTVAPL